MEVKLRYEEIPMSEKFYIIRFDILHDEQSIIFKEEIYMEMNLNIVEQLGSVRQIW